jgi:hypothetical protein
MKVYFIPLEEKQRRRKMRRKREMNNKIIRIRRIK